MIASYAVYVRREVLETLLTLPGADRDRVLHVVAALADDPFKPGELTATAPSGRTLQVKLLGRLALYYRPDHADREIRIVDLVDADRV